MSRHRRPYDPIQVAMAISNPDRHLLDEVDPSKLLANQPSITRAGVAWYLTNRYFHTGQTYADRDVASNRIPIVYTRNGTDHVVLSGHHRAAAALITDRPLFALHVFGSWGPKR